MLRDTSKNVDGRLWLPSIYLLYIKCWILPCPTAPTGKPTRVYESARVNTNCTMLYNTAAAGYRTWTTGCRTKLHSTIQACRIPQNVARYAQYRSYPWLSVRLLNYVECLNTPERPHGNNNSANPGGNTPSPATVECVHLTSAY